VVRADRPRWQLFGDTVNVASRMESTGLPGVVQISQDMFRALEASSVEFKAVPRGIIQIKGKGDQLTYILQLVNLGELAKRISMSRLSVFNPPECKMRTRSFSTSKITIVSPVDPIFRAQSLEYFEHDTLTTASSSSLPVALSRNFSGGQRHSMSSSTLSSTLADASDPSREARLVSLREELDEEMAERSRESLSQRISDHSPNDQLAVLLVDDMLSVLMQYRRVLQNSGVQVFTARDGFEGLFLMQQRMFVAVFMDLNMPKMSGGECVYKFRKWENDNRVQKQYIFALSGKDELKKDERAQLFAKGFDAIESKTNSKAAILRFVAELMENAEHQR